MKSTGSPGMKKKETKCEGTHKKNNKKSISYFTENFHEVLNAHSPKAGS